MTAFDSFGAIKPTFSIMLSFLLGLIFPDLAMRLPTSRKESFKSITRSTRGIATELLDKAAKEKAGVSAGGEVDKSILGTLGENFRFLLTIVCSG